MSDWPAQVEQRLAALEQREIEVNDLPIKPLRKRLASLDEIEGSTTETVQQVRPAGAAGVAVGPWPTLPPAATDTYAFTVTASGTYAALFTTSAYRAAAGDGEIKVYVDGALVATLPWYFNTAGEQNVIPPQSVALELTAGTHYVYFQGDGVLSSDSYDIASYLFVRIG